MKKSHKTNYTDLTYQQVPQDRTNKSEPIIKGLTTS